MKRTSFIVISLLLASCSEEFDPTSPGKRPFAVFSVLSAISETQIVRVYATNEPTDPPTIFKPVAGTVVRLIGPHGTSQLTDTTIHFVFPDGRADSMLAHRTNGPKPVRGSSYELQVSTSEGIARSSCLVPDVAELYTSDYFVLQDPYDYEDFRGINLRITPSVEALGFVVRLVIVYHAFIDGQWVPQEAEVPQRVYEMDPDFGFIRVDYPTFVRRSKYRIENFGFVNAMYQILLKSIYKKHIRPNVKLDRAVFIVTQADEHFFNYFGVANGFQDPNTIRVDRPDYSNMEGALGVFGAFANDSLSFDIPEDLYPPNF